MGSLPTEPEAWSVAVDPVDPRRAYALGPAGMFRSDDAGLSWVRIALDIAAEPVALAQDQSSVGRLFLLLDDGGLMSSLDGATTWQAVEE